METLSAAPVLTNIVHTFVASW